MTWTRRKALAAAGLLALGLVSEPTPAQAQRYGRGAEQTVSSWYRQYLNRGMDPGARQWLDMLRDGEDPRYVQAGIIGSQEYFDLCRQDPGRFVDKMYRDVVGQRPGRRDFDYWAGRVANGEDRAEVALDFLSQYGR